MRNILRKATLAVYFTIGRIYWGIVRRIITIWGQYGLHAICIGEFVSGEEKKRSLFREDMLLRAIVLFIDLRGKSCLDLACNDGFWSFRFGRFGIKKLVGIDIRKRNIVRANFLKTVYNFPGFQFKHQDIFRFLYHDNKESYDIIFLLSVIYHLPEVTDWYKFFNTIYSINNECLIIDTRWFDDDEYFYDRTSEQAIIKAGQGVIKKWRPTRNEVFSYLYKSGYEKVLEVNPSAFLNDSKEAFGDGNPYSVENVSDYISNHRSIVIAYKKKAVIPDIEGRLNIKYPGYRDIRDKNSSIS